MGSALISGAIQSKFLQPKQIHVYDIDKKKSSALQKKYKIFAHHNISETITNANFIFLCVKPQHIKNVLTEIAPQIKTHQCLISIAAGIKIETIEKNFTTHIPLIRIMPNTPALIQKGMSAITAGTYSNAKHIQFVKKFFTSVGHICVLSEKHFDTVTAVSGSGPAYVFYLAEGLEKAAIKMGLEPITAKQLAVQTIAGAAQMLLQKESAEELRKKVTSPGGTTEAAISELEKQNWLNHFIQAVEIAAKKAKELSTLSI